MKLCKSGVREKFARTNANVLWSISCLAFFFFFSQELCYWSPFVCVGMSGFGVHHDRRGGSAHLDGEALHRTSAVHTCSGGRTGTLLLQLVIHLHSREKRSIPNLTFLKGFDSNIRLNMTPLTTRDLRPSLMGWFTALKTILYKRTFEFIKMLLLFWQVNDVIISRLGTCTEEGKKVQRNGGKTFLAVFRRIEETSWERRV